MEQKSFRAGMAILSRHFGAVEEYQTKTLWAFLKDVPDDRWMAAVSYLACSRSPAKGFPLLPEIEEVVGVDEYAEAEWNAIVRAARGSEPPQLSEAGVSALQSLGGLSALTFEKDMPFLKRSFLANFKRSPKPRFSATGLNQLESKPELQLQGN